MLGGTLKLLALVSLAFALLTGAGERPGRPGGVAGVGLADAPICALHGDKSQPSPQQKHGHDCAACQICVDTAAVSAPHAISWGLAWAPRSKTCRLGGDAAAAPLLAAYSAHRARASPSLA
jgi:hypothetical protein